jgi:hypothetical protein
VRSNESLAGSLAERLGQKPFTLPPLELSYMQDLSSLSSEMDRAADDLSLGYYTHKSINYQKPKSSG